MSDDDQHQPDPEQLRDESDRLLRAVEELRRLEREKRGIEMSTPAFHALAERISEVSRRVFELAHDEQADGEAIEGPQDTTIDAVDD